MCLLIFARALVLPTSAATLTAGYTIGSGLLGSSLIIDNANTGGGDSSSSTGNLGWTAELAGLWNSNSVISLSGMALPIFSDTNTANTTVSGTFTFYFYDLDSGANANNFDGTGVETLLGTATASFTQGAVGTYYAVFNSPINFTAKSTGVAVRIINTGWLRLKIVPSASAPGVVLKSSTAGTNIGGANPNFRISIAGTVFSPSIFPPRVNLAKYQVTTSSTTNGQYVPDFVNDGLVNNNSWRTANVTTTHWAEIDFPMPATIASAHIYSGIDDGSVLASFKLQYKSGASWLDAPGSARSGNTSPEVNVIFSNAVTSAAFRLYSDDNNTQRVKEIALFPPNTNGVEQGYPIGTDVEMNLAKKRPAVVTAFSGANYPKLAVDGFVDSLSKWQTTLVVSNSLQVDLRIAAKIGSAHLYSGDGAVPPIANFILQYWDGSAWQNISGGAVSGNTNTALVVDFTTEPTTTLVRLVFTNSSVSAVRELCIFPANGGVGYPLGQDVVLAPPPTLNWDDYNDAFYNVINRAANLSATVSSGTPSLGNTNLADQLNQYQVLLNIGTDTYRLRNRVTGRCLVGAGVSTNAGALLVDQDYTGMPHQNWRLGPINGTDFYLINQWSGLVVDTQGGSLTTGTALVQNPVSGANSQRWRFAFKTSYPKKGLAGYTSNWSSFKGNWAYNWGRETTTSLPLDVIFNPMQWGNFNWDIGSNQGPVEQFVSEWHREDKAVHYMGFNEPDGAGQANLTVDQAISLWPRLERMNMPLVSPAPVNPGNSWITNFMGQANSLGFQVDALATHTYPSPNGGSSDLLVSSLQSYNSSLGLPVWLTEFSTVDWSTNNAGKWTEEDNYNWLAEFMWRAESLPWLRHYSLFLFTADSNNPTTTSPSDPVGQRSNAFQTNGTPTSFGELYFAWDCDANVRQDTAYFIHNRGEHDRIRNTISSNAPTVGTIRESTNTTQWVLRPSDVAGQYYIVSLRDGRRLRCTNGVVNFAPAQTTGATVRWNWTEYQYGWFYLENPAAPTGSRRLRDNAGTFSMVANTTTTNQAQWRFVVPYAPVETAAPAAPANLTATGGTNRVSLTWAASGAADFSFYSVYRSTTSGTNYSLIASNLASATYLDLGVIIGTNYFYVLTATDLVGYESSYSSEASAVPLPPWPTTPTNITYAVSNSSLILRWPSNYTGWLLQAQTNQLNTGLRTNWATIAGSSNTNSYVIPMNPASPAVFYRLKLP